MEGPTRAGVRVTPRLALQLDAVYACVKVLAETIAYLPIGVYEWTNDEGDRRSVRQLPLYDVLHNMPNNWQTAFEYKEMKMGHLALRGAGFDLIVPGERGPIDQLIPFHPDTVQVEQLESGRLVYRHSPARGPQKTYLQEEIFHLHGLSSDGVRGLDPVAIARESFATAIATEEYGARMYRNGAQLGGVLSHPNKLGGDAQKNLEASFDRKYAGSSNSFKTLVLEEGMTWTQIGMRARDAQYLESRKFSVSQIARIFRVPPHMIADLERSTNNNIEQQSIEFVIYTLGPWLVRWEQAIARDLILDRSRFFAEFNVDALLRGDTLSRFTAYGIGIDKGFMTRNQARRKENWAPIDGLDTPLRAMNMADGQTPPSEQALVASRQRNRQFVLVASERLAQKETAAVTKIVAKAKGPELRSKLEEFYAGFATDVSRSLLVSPADAQALAESSMYSFVAAGEQAGELLKGMKEKRVSAYSALGMIKGEDLHAAA